MCPSWVGWVGGQTRGREPRTPRPGSARRSVPAGARRRPDRCLGQRRAHQPHRTEHQERSPAVDAPGRLTAAHVVPAGPLAVWARQDRGTCRQRGEGDWQVDRKIQRQLDSTSSPPSTGPLPAATAPTAAQTPTAVPR
jgi:hypothetical protein